MVAPLLGMAARQIAKKVAKKIAENPQKSLLGGSSASLGTGTYLLDATTDKSYEGPTVRDQIKDSVKAKTVKDEETESQPEKKRSGGKVSSASKRADGIATKGKTRGRYI